MGIVAARHSTDASELSSALDCARNWGFRTGGLGIRVVNGRLAWPPAGRSAHGLQPAFAWCWILASPVEGDVPGPPTA